MSLSVLINLFTHIFPCRAGWSGAATRTTESTGAVTSTQFLVSSRPVRSASEAGGRNSGGAPGQLRKPWRTGTTVHAFLPK